MEEEICLGCGGRKSKYKIDENGKHYCPFCGYEDDEIVLPADVLEVIKKSNRYRDIFDYEKALETINGLLASEPDNPIYNWHAMLAEYRITFIDNGKYEDPTFFETDNPVPITESKYYANLTPRRKAIARQIEEERVRFNAEEKKVEKYDVFISYKKHMLNDSTRDTTEARWANALHHHLDKMGYRVFYDEESLDQSNLEWQPHIYAALKSARILILLGSSIENIEATWVKNEWMRYLAYKRHDNNKTICLLGLNIEANDLPNDELRLTQMVRADAGDWLNIIAKRVALAVDKKNEKVLKQSNRYLAKKPLVERLIKVENKIDVAKNGALDLIIDALNDNHRRKSAINRFNALYRESKANSMLSSKEIAIRYVIDKELTNFNDLFNVYKASELDDPDIYIDILNASDDPSFISQVLSFIYSFICETNDVRRNALLFKEAIKFEHPHRRDFLFAVFQKIKFNPNLNKAFDTILPLLNLSAEGDASSLLEYARLELKEKNYSLAIYYAEKILKECEPKSHQALELIFFAKNKANDCKSTFSFARILNQDKQPIDYESLKNLANNLPINERKCPKCNSVYGKMPDSKIYKCPRCGNAEVFNEEKQDRTSFLDEILKSSLDSIPLAKLESQAQVRFGYNAIDITNCYRKFLENLLPLYTAENAKLRYVYVANILHQKRLYDLASECYLKALNTAAAPNNELYYNLLLCDLNATSVDEMIERDKPIDSSKYYLKAISGYLANSSESNELKEALKKQNERIRLRTSPLPCVNGQPKALASNTKEKKIAIDEHRVKIAFSQIFTLLLIVLFLIAHLSSLLYVRIDLMLNNILGANNLIYFKVLEGLVLFDLLLSFGKKRILSKNFFIRLFRIIDILLIILITVFAFA